MHEAVSGTRAHPEAGPRRCGNRAAPGDAGPGDGAGAGAALRGAALPPTARHHLPLKMRILLMAAKVAVTLDSKSASCTPVLRKAPAEGLFSQ